MRTYDEVTTNANHGIREQAERIWRRISGGSELWRSNQDSQDRRHVSESITSLSNTTPIERQHSNPNRRSSGQNASNNRHFQ